MKNRHVKFLLLFISFQASYSQTIIFEIKKDLHLTYNTGSEIKTDTITTDHHKLVVGAGISKTTTIQSELVCTTQGIGYKNTTKDLKNQLDCISNRVMLKIKLSKSSLVEVGTKMVSYEAMNKKLIQKKQTFSILQIKQA